MARGTDDITENEGFPLEPLIRTIPDYPKAGIQFRDITTLLSDPAGLRASIDRIAKRYASAQIDCVAGIEARGFIFGSTVAYQLDIGLIPIRKAGKLPYKTIGTSYALEYGEATVEIHVDAVEKGDKVLLLDDLLATGGTAAAGVELIEKLGGEVVEIDFLIELAFLNGREKLPGHEIFAPIVY